MTEYKFHFQDLDEAIAVFGNRFATTDENGNTIPWDGSASISVNKDGEHLVLVREPLSITGYDENGEPIMSQPSWQGVHFDALLTESIAEENQINVTTPAHAFA